MSSGTPPLVVDSGIDLAQPALARPPRQKASVRGAVSMLEAKIAIIDDEPVNIRVTRKYLSTAGYSNFVTSDDALQALDLIKEEVPDIVLLDVVMPNVSGLAILDQIRQVNRIAATPVIILTASTDPQTKMQALELGATDFLAKPVDPSELVLRVRNALITKAHQDHLEMYAEHLEEEVRQRTAELAISRKEVVECLARAAEYRDEQTGHHIVRVGRYAAILAERLGLSPQHVELVEQAAQLHDVGKIGIPDDILRKPAKLDDEEFALMKRHCAHGQKILQRMSDDEFCHVQKHPEVGAMIMRSRSSKLIELAATIALTHHERWDGTGYPNGIAGEAIPIEGRLTAIADVYDALTSVRAYKRAFSHRESAELIVEGSGNHFDPNLVRIFCEVHEDFDRIRQELGDE